MEIVETFSHLHGLEFLLVHQSKLWEEVREAIGSESIAVTLRDRNWSERCVEERSTLYTGIGQRAGPSVSHEHSFDKGGVTLSLLLDPDHVSSPLRLARLSALYRQEQIDVGVEILPMRLGAAALSEANSFESECDYIKNQGRNVPLVPLVLVGVN